MDGFLKRFEIGVSYSSSIISNFLMGIETCGSSEVSDSTAVLLDKEIRKSTLCIETRIKSVSNQCIVARRNESQ